MDLRCPSISAVHASTPLVALAFFLVALAGALPPVYRRWTHLGLHRLVSVAAGIFLGSIFLHLLPELARGSHVPAASHAPPTDSILPWCALLAGFLLLFAVERVWLQGRAQAKRPDAHAVLLSATFVGLALHSLTFGLGLGAMIDRLATDWPLLVSLLIHKAAETFSLGVVMSLAHLSRPRTLLLLLSFAAIEPAGIFLGESFANQESALEPILTGFACGTFLYVAVCDLLPEVFHDSERGWGKLGWLLLGTLISAVSLQGAEGLPELVRGALVASGDVFVQMAPYLLIGFLVAGVLSQLIKPELLVRHLSKNDLRSVVKAAIVGAPLPLCSCSVVPIALSFRKHGASKGATSAFLISTPETGVDSIAVTWALLDPVLTVMRPIAAILSGILTGSAVNAYVRRRESKSEASSAAELQARDEHACCAETAAGETRPRERFLGRAMRFAFVDLLDDLAAALIAGILLSGAIEALLPDDFFASSPLRGFPAMLVMLLVGIPVYVCASASTPIAASLILKGLSPGAAFVFLLAGPATNLASLLALTGTLGKRVLVVHLVTLAVVTLGMGYAVDALYPLLGLTPSARLGEHHEMLPHWFSTACAVVLGLLLAWSLARKHLLRGERVHAEVLATDPGRP